MVQKIIQVGNSLAITIPSGFVKEVGLQAGQTIRVDQDRDEQILTVQPVQQAVSHVDKEVYAVAENLLKRYLPAFKELAKK